MITRKLTVSEGGDTKFINIISNIPVDLFCTPDDRKKYCQVFVKPEIETTSKEKKCSDGSQIIQAVFGWNKNMDKPDKFCKFAFERESGSSIKIPIRATIDGIFDKNQKRSINVFFEIMVNGIIEKIHSLGTTEVSAFSFPFTFFFTG